MKTINEKRRIRILSLCLSLLCFTGLIYLISLNEQHKKHIEEVRNGKEFLYPDNQMLIDVVETKRNGDIVHIKRAFGWPKTDEIMLRISILPLTFGTEEQMISLKLEGGETLLFDPNGNAWRKVQENDTIRKMINFAEPDERYVIKKTVYSGNTPQDIKEIPVPVKLN